MKQELLNGQLIGDEAILSLSEICLACDVKVEWVYELVDQAVLEPGFKGDELHFSGSSLRRVRIVKSLEEDLGINPAGAALVIELLEKIENLQARLNRQV